ncbi:MAG TPA: rod shape-determining protein MreD [Mycobacteriales bacterium]|nr:rod shape-determining protein MreD [Mycobacteriales bacterium]
MTKVTPAGAAALSVLTVLAVVLQESVLARLPLPGGAPNLLVVLVVGVALAAGASAGMAAGFATGLLADLSSAHPVGVLALCFGLVGFLAGLLDADTERGVVRAFAVVAVAAASTYLIYLGLLAVLHRPPAGGLADLPSTVLYDVMLTPFVVPVVAALARRLDPDPRR